MTAERLKDGQLFGVAAIDDLLETVQFPISKEALLEQYGQKEIFWLQDERKKLVELLGDSSQEEFYSISDVVSVLSKP